MKAISLLSILCVLTVQGADFTASGIFQTPVSLEDGEVKPAGGVNLRGIFWRGWGADVDLIQSATRDSFLDRSAIHLVYSKDIHKGLCGFVFAGGAYDFEDDEHGAEVGAGLEYEITARIVASASLRWQKDDTEEHLAVPTLGLGWRF